MGDIDAFTRPYCPRGHGQLAVTVDEGILFCEECEYEYHPRGQ